MKDDPRVDRIRTVIESRRLAISVVTLGELRYGALAAGWQEERTALLEAELRTYGTVPVDAYVAERYAAVRMRCERMGRRKDDNDLWIAATAIHYGIPLASLDRDHLDIPGLRVIGADGVEVSVPG